jgi:WD40 repeat protein
MAPTGRKDRKATVPGAPPTPEAGRHDAFISYAREDKAFVADVLSPALRRRGKNVWVDLTDIPPAADWRERIRQGIEASKAFVFVLSPDAARSPECARECSQAVQMHKRLVPAVYRDVDPEEVPRELRAPNWVPLDEGEQFERQLDTLVYALEADLDWRDAHARLAVRAREWQEADRDRSYLLRGRDLREAQAWLAGAERHREAPTELQVEYVESSGQFAGRRRRVGILGGLVTVAALAVLGLVALAGREEASEQSDIARSRQLAAAARARVDADPELSLLLAREGVRLNQTEEAVAALRRVLARPLPGPALMLPSPPVAPPEVTADGRHVLEVSEDRAARIWDLRSRELVATLGRHRDVEANYPGEVDFSAPVSAALAPRGRLAATAGRDGVLRVWRWPAARPLTQLDLGQPLNGLAMSSNGRLLAVGTFSNENYDGEGEVHVVDWRSGMRVARLRAPIGPTGLLNGQVLRVAFDPSGRRVAAGHLSSTAFVWDIASRTVLARLPVRAGARDVAFSDDGRHLVTARPEAVEVWNVSDGERLAILRGGGEPSTARFGHGGEAVLTAAQDGKARLWDWRRKQVRAIVGGDSPLVGAAFGSGSSIVTGDARAIRQWQDLETPRVSLRGAEGDELTSVTFSRDGKVLVTGGVYHPPDAATPVRFVRVWDLARRRGVATLDEAPQPAGDSGYYYRVAVSPDGGLVAGAGESGTAHVWDWRRRVLLARLPLAPGPPGDLTFLANREQLATVAPGDLRVWEWDRERVAGRLRPFSSQTRPVYLRLAFAERAGVLVAANGSSVQAWDVARRRPLRRIDLQPTIQEVDVTADGRFVAAALEQHGTRVWDRSANRVVADLRDDIGFSADFSRDAALLATSDRGTGARLWDWTRDETLTRLRPFREPDELTGWSWDVAFSPDARRVAAVDRSATAYVYDCRACAPAEDLLAQADRRATRGLTAAERRRFLGE